MSTRPVRAPRVLIVKLAAMGDTVMASTMPGAVRARWPEAHITWVTGAALAPLVGRFEGVDRVVVIDADALLAGRGIPRLGAALRAYWAIGRGPFDVALLAHADPRYRVLLRGTRVRDLRVFGGGRHAGPLPGRWHGEAYARLASDAPARFARLRWPEGAAPARAGARHVLLAPGGARNVLRDNPLRRWPVEHWCAVATALDAAGCRLTVIGAPSDAVETSAVLRAVPRAEDAVGKDSIERLLARIAAADAVVTHDSGVSHLAQLSDTPTVALFGPTPPASFVAPQARVTVLSAAAGLACAPCYDGRDYAPCALNRCLADLPPARVVEAVLALLA